MLIIFNNPCMNPSVEQTVERFKKTIAKVRREIDTPAKARRHLLEIGILEKHRGSKNGVRLASRFR